MLQISSKRETKAIEIDGHGFHIRKPGAGESLTLQKSGRELTALSKLKRRTSAQNAQAEELSSELLELCLGLYRGMDDEAQAYLQTLEVDVLLEGLNAVFNTEVHEQSAAGQPAEAA